MMHRKQGDVLRDADTQFLCLPLQAFLDLGSDTDGHTNRLLPVVSLLCRPII